MVHRQDLDHAGWQQEAAAGDVQGDMVELILVRLFIVYANAAALVGWLLGAIWDWCHEADR